MSLLDKFKTAEARKQKAIAAADAELARVAAQRQADIDARFLLERTRGARNEAAIARLAESAEQFIRILHSIDEADQDLDLGFVVRQAFRLADVRLGRSADNLHFYETTPSVHLLASILGRNPYYF